MDVRTGTACEPVAALSPELLLIRVLISAHLRTLPRKKAQAFLSEATALLATEEAVSKLLPIRGDVGAGVQARREAVAMYRALLPTFVAAMERG